MVECSLFFRELLADSHLESLKHNPTNFPYSFTARLTVLRSIDRTNRLNNRIHNFVRRPTARRALFNPPAGSAPVLLHLA